MRRDYGLIELRGAMMAIGGTAWDCMRGGATPVGNPPPFRVECQTADSVCVIERSNRSSILREKGNSLAEDCSA